MSKVQFRRECVCGVCLKHEPLALDIRSAIQNEGNHINATILIVFIILLFRAENQPK